MAWRPALSCARRTDLWSSPRCAERSAATVALYGCGNRCPESSRKLRDSQRCVSSRNPEARPAGSWRGHGAGGVLRGPPSTAPLLPPSGKWGPGWACSGAPLPGGCCSPAPGTGAVSAPALLLRGPAKWERGSLSDSQAGKGSWASQRPPPRTLY